MLKNFIIILVMVGTLWSTPASFTIQEGLGLGTQIASAQIPPPRTSVPATQLPTQEAQDPATAFKLKCFGGWYPELNLGDCAAMVGYGVFYVPTALILQAGGAIFDAFMALSLDKFLLNQRFVRDTWGVVRDLANLVFILILLWIAIATILNIGGVQLKQAVVNVVIIALLINFSYFFTRVVIDASNVVAWEFYSAIGGGGQVSTGNHIARVTEYRISEKIVGAVSPQKLLSPETFTAWSKKNDASKGYLFFLFLLGGIVNLVLAYVLFYAGFLLLGRVIAFVFLIVASPLAFISYALPKGGGFTSSWWNQLLSQAMVAPVFLFFLYVIVQLAGAGLTMFNTGGGGNITSNFTEILTTLLLKASIVVVALMIALNKTKSLSGAAGSYATKAGTTAFSVATGAALGGAAFASRHTAGRLANRVLEKNEGKMQEWASRSRLGQITLDATRGTAKGSHDIRAVPGVSGAIGRFGINTGSAGGKGGFQGRVETRVERQKKTLEELKEGRTKDEAKKIEQQYAERLAAGGGSMWGTVARKGNITAGARLQKLAEAKSEKKNLQDTIRETKERREDKQREIGNTNASLNEARKINNASEINRLQTLIEQQTQERKDISKEVEGLEGKIKDQEEIIKRGISRSQGSADKTDK